MDPETNYQSVEESEWPPHYILFTELETKSIPEPFVDRKSIPDRKVDTLPTDNVNESTSSRIRYHIWLNGVPYASTDRYQKAQRKAYKKIQIISNMLQVPTHILIHHDIYALMSYGVELCRITITRQ